MVATNKFFFHGQRFEDPAIFWFRRDLRISDHPALTELTKQQVLVAPIFLYSSDPQSPARLGGAATWWQKKSLKNLNKQIGGRLRFGEISPEPRTETLNRSEFPVTNALVSICRKLDIRTVVVSECVFSKISYPQYEVLKNGHSSTHWKEGLESRAFFDQQIGDELSQNGIELVIFPESDLAEPGQISKDDLSSYQVFTPFYKKFLNEIQGTAFDVDFKPASVNWLNWKKQIGKRANQEGENFVSSEVLLESEENCSWLGEFDRWTSKLELTWDPGASFAERVLKQFSENRVSRYEKDRDYPAIQGTSHLSPYLAFGEISARQVWSYIANGMPVERVDSERMPFLRQLVWRLFSKETLRSHPGMVIGNFQKKFDQFQWRNDLEELEMWKRGETGVPIVDAAMKQLWNTGWMHNRLRMVVGSFLVKNLQIHWSYGERWFWDTLVDADLANNVFGWQWVAGCGMDAAPFFRIFNPVTQSQKYDSEGSFLREYLPELSCLDSKQIHDPFGRLATSSKNKTNSQNLFIHNLHYPEPMTCLKSSRADTLEKLKKISK